MTAKEYLEQYMALNAELEQIDQRLRKLSAEPTHYATDCVMASPAHEPYQNRPVPIRGNVQEKDVLAERKSLADYYRRQRKKLYEACLKAEGIISRVDDAKARLIIRYRYIERMEWNDIAAKIGHGATIGGLKMYTKRYLEKIL